VPEYFADREGLSGTARERFLRLLKQTFRVTESPPGRRWPALLAAAAVSGPVCLVLDLRGGGDPLWTKIGWLAFSAVGVALALGCRRAARVTAPADPEVQWRVYCLLIRPALLAEFPGLLDRNLRDDRSESESLVVKPAAAVQLMYADRGDDFWSSALWGLWIGMAGGLLSRLYLSAVPATWSFALPVAGMAAGPIMWALWECWAFAHVWRKVSGWRR